nr:retrovirus-related Pol polyprotein from transposon TNT 1-94 [Tanacetum cinerariifolium]
MMVVVMGSSGSCGEEVGYVRDSVAGLAGNLGLTMSKDETPEVLIDFLRLVQRGLQTQVRVVQTDKGMEFLNQTLHAYFAAEGIHHQTSVARTPEQNGVVERRNRTLVEAARTMLSAAKVPIFFWAEAIATACFTQNRSLVIPRHEKTPYHIINDRKPSVKFFYIFGSVCYIVRDGENLDKMKEKCDECIFVGYSTQSRAYRVYNKRTRVIMESIHVNFDELPHMASVQNSSDPAPTRQKMASAHISSDPGPTRQSMASAHISSDPGPTRQSMASAHNSSDPAPTRQKMASAHISSDPGPTRQSMASAHISSDPGPTRQSMASAHISSDPGPRRQSMASAHISSDPGPTRQSMASAHISSDPGPRRQSMASAHNSFDPAPIRQSMASVQISSDPAPEHQTMVLEHGSLSPGSNCQENVSHGDKTGTTSNELDLLFSPMFDELLNGSSKVVSKSSAVSAADAPNQRQQPTTPLNNHTTSTPTCQTPPITTFVISSKNITQAEPHAENDEVANDEFINIFSTSVQDQGETSSRHVDSSNMHT